MLEGNYLASKIEHIAFRESPEAMVIVDTKGEIVLANSQACLLFKYNEKELIGANTKKLIPGQHKKNHTNYIEEYFKNPHFRPMGNGIKTYGITKDHKKLPLEISLKPITVDEITFVCASIKDITNKLVIENKFHRLLESAPDAMIFVNKMGIITLVNRQAELVFEYARKDMVGNPISLLLPQKFKVSHNENIANFFTTPTMRIMGSNDPLFALRSNGEEFPVEITLSPIETEGGLMVCASVRDVTSRRYIAELEGKNNTLEQFNYVVSHDLQEPLNTILGFLNLLEISPNMTEDEKKVFINHIKNSAESMKSLIAGLLDFSKIGMNMVPEMLNLNEMMDQIIHDLASIIELKEATIDVGNLPETIGYKTELKSVFQNLITNALKFHNEDAHPIVKVNVEKLDREWKFSVSDNGIGINEQDKERIFNIFKRVDKSRFGGSGIGLAHVKKIITLFNGKIWIESQPKVGTTVYFTLPIF